MDSGPNVEEGKSWDELYTVDFMPSELFLKFRKEIQGFRVGVNMEFYNAPSNEFESKLVLKPLANDRRWKFMYAPLHHDVRLMSKKIPVTNFLNLQASSLVLCLSLLLPFNILWLILVGFKLLQVGVGHSFGLKSTGLNWKLSTCLGGDGLSRIRNKTSLGVCPGVDLRFAWKADYVLPEFNGAVGTGQPLFNMNSGSFHASLDRVELILTHTTEHVPYNQVPEDDKSQPSPCSDIQIS